MSLPPSYSYSEINRSIEPVDLLPSYTTGAEIRPLPGSPQHATPPLLRIDLSPECHERESFDIGDILLGHLVLAPRAPLQLAQLAVVFGYDEVVKQHRWVSDTVTSKFGRLNEYIVPRSSFPASNRSENGAGMLMPGFEYSFPFAVQVPELQMESNCKHESAQDAQLHQRLPPSLGSPPDRNIPAENIENNDARVSYKLVATARMANQPEPRVHVTEYLHVVPSYAAPRRAPAHLYTKRFDVRPRDFLRRTGFRGVVEMKLDGAATIVMRGAPTVATLVLAATPATPGLPPPAIAEIFVKLVAYTEYLNEAPKCNTFGLAVPAPSSSQWTFSAPRAGEAGKLVATRLVMPLKLKLPQARVITPTFVSCIVERKYTLTVSVVLRDHSILALEVPVNIVADVQPRSAAPYAVDTPTPIHLASSPSEYGIDGTSSVMNSLGSEHQQRNYRPQSRNTHRRGYELNPRISSSSSTSSISSSSGSLDSSGRRCSSHNGGGHSTVGGGGVRRRRRRGTPAASAAPAAAGTTAMTIPDPPSYICI
ncbi:hypothetical protein D0Z00_000256 [Geotrichum galactomycetum]|uniref:Uncharacterized protein n=1 Tax=Geotrichum galactomycetum TaxID=27317 RepID=A0ACB6VB46_9ASCO|nr:hypothetical protein D0Z00_000256 [Geotrichum candidum]